LLGLNTGRSKSEGVNVLFFYNREKQWGLFKRFKFLLLTLPFGYKPKKHVPKQVCLFVLVLLTISGTGSKVHRKAGEIWPVHGPKEYLPPVEVKVLGPSYVKKMGNYRLDFLIIYFIVSLVSLFLLWLLF
jgi:hypothetical protein